MAILLMHSMCIVHYRRVAIHLKGSELLHDQMAVSRLIQWPCLGRWDKVLIDLEGIKILWLWMETMKAYRGIIMAWRHFLLTSALETCE